MENNTQEIKVKYKEVIVIHLLSNNFVELKKVSTQIVNFQPKRASHKDKDNYVAISYVRENTEEQNENYNKSKQQH